MIVLDTNVLSELMRPAPEERVTGWVAARPAASLFTTTITQAEILYGVAVLPEGRRRDALAAAVQSLFGEDLAGRVLPFDAEAAQAYAVVAAKRRKAGQPMAQFDAQIAAICLSRGAALATRNLADFIGCGVDVVNPWAP
ncbi:MAG: PIN domain-containing protein [Deferrisomatales bacterium]